MVEVQIRTERMDEIVEHGLAAHCMGIKASKVKAASTNGYQYTVCLGK